MGAKFSVVAFDKRCTTYPVSTHPTPTTLCKVDFVARKLDEIMFVSQEVEMVECARWSYFHYTSGQLLQVDTMQTHN